MHVFDEGEITAEARASGLRNDDGLDGPGTEQAQDGILSVLRERTGHDFRHYKRATILRRLERRLRARGTPDLAAYRALLERDDTEPEALLRDLLIGVTAYFRDRESFDALERQVVPDLLAGKAPGEPVRAWVAACSTGEEAYSLGMLLADGAARLDPPPAYQVFASDIDARAIAVARGGRYPPAIAGEVSRERLARHFALEDGRYKVRKALRDRILFAPHNLLHDPAFCRLDLVTCRNFLIYLERDMHRRVLQLFHAALLPGGYLFLGSSESADTVPHLFEPVDSWHRIYRAKPAADLHRRLSLVREMPLASLAGAGNIAHPDTRPRQHQLMLEAAGSGLRRTNEELVCLVDELRATVEKLETGQEELQSRNEELRIVNAEQQVAVDETGKANDDLANLIASTDIATLFLDRDLRIKRCTPHVARVFNIIPADIGRPLAHITHRLDFPELFEKIRAVLATLDPAEREARGTDGREYIVRIHPYRTADDQIDGVVLTFFDITYRRQAEEALQAGEAHYRADLERQVRERTAELKQSRDLLQGTMDASTDMIQVFRAIRDAHGVIIDFQWLLNNHTSEVKYGEVRGESLLERNPGVVPTGIFDTFREVTETGIPQQHERHYVHEQFDGWFLQSVVKLDDGVATTTKEITAWKAAQDELLRLRDEMAQAKLRDIEAKYRGLIDLVPAAVYACNADGTLACSNGRAAVLWGGMPAAGDTAWPLRGAWRSYLPDGTPVEPGTSPMAGVLATGEPVVNRALRLERLDRSVVNVLVNITPLRDSAGNVTGAINVFQDAATRVASR